MTARYAIYFAPEDDTALARFGEVALKRCPDGRESLLAPIFCHDLERHHELAAFPRHYGFHATIKAPFELAVNQMPEALNAKLADFCARQSSVPLVDIKPRLISTFTALAGTDSEALRHLAFDCVRALEPFRAPLSDADIERRNPDKLSPSKRHNLMTYGYPSVGDEFRFHMTLSGQADPDFLQFLKNIYADMVPDAPVVDRLALFMQPDRKSRFVRLESYPLAR